MVKSMVARRIHGGALAETSHSSSLARRLAVEGRKGWSLAWRCSRGHGRDGVVHCPSRDGGAVLLPRPPPVPTSLLPL
jgi:hypothetical protein